MKKELSKGIDRAWAGFRIAALLGITLTLVLPPALAATCRVEHPADRELFALSLEELMQIEVTSVSKKAQQLADAAAAVFVITGEDIRRSGATSIPEALRLAPGLQVARIDANKWAISARGFNGRFANKLLVLIDGRSVYTPIFTGVFWDVQDTLLEDVERIEVIRGPGAALWGANAVNGVINIITKTAADTPGALVSAGGGSEENAFGTLRYGGALGENSHYRVYAKYFDRDGSVAPAGEELADEWSVVRGGFRLDGQGHGGSVWTLQGDAYDGESGDESLRATLEPPSFSRLEEARNDLSGGNLLARWGQRFSPTSDFQLQLYYDVTSREIEPFGKEQRHTFDADFHHRFALGNAQEILWGLGHRATRDQIDIRTTGIALEPERRTVHLFSGFVQDEIDLLKDRLHLILGSKLEHNDYTGLELQPNARLLWTPGARHTLWGAVSRAVRTPGRAEEDARFTLATQPPTPPLLPLPTQFTLEEGSNPDAEELLAFDLGYRFSAAHFSLDVAAFYNLYDDLVTFEPGAPTPQGTPVPTSLTVPLRIENKADAETYGVEVVADWRATPWWRLVGTYTFLQVQLHLDSDSNSVLGERAEGNSPHHQFSLRSALDLPKGVELDLWLRYVDALSAPDIPSYFTLDARLGWRPRPALELALVGQNLLDGQHTEFVDEFLFTRQAEIERGIYAKVTWWF